MSSEDDKIVFHSVTIISGIDMGQSSLALGGWRLCCDGRSQKSGEPDVWISRNTVDHRVLHVHAMAGKIRGEVGLEQLELSYLRVTLAGKLAEVLLGLVHWATMD